MVWWLQEENRRLREQLALHTRHPPSATTPATPRHPFPPSLELERSERASGDEETVPEVSPVTAVVVVDRYPATPLQSCIRGRRPASRARGTVRFSLVVQQQSALRGIQVHLWNAYVKPLVTTKEDLAPVVVETVNRNPLFLRTFPTRLAVYQKTKALVVVKSMADYLPLLSCQQQLRQERDGEGDAAAFFTSLVAKWQPTSEYLCRIMDVFTCEGTAREEVLDELDTSSTNSLGDEPNPDEQTVDKMVSNKLAQLAEVKGWAQSGSARQLQSQAFLVCREYAAGSRPLSFYLHPGSRGGADGAVAAVDLQCLDCLATIAWQVLSGLNDLRETGRGAPGLCHGNLKPSNIFISERDGTVGQVKLADYGVPLFPAPLLACYSSVAVCAADVVDVGHQFLSPVRYYRLQDFTSEYGVQHEVNQRWALLAPECRLQSCKGGGARYVHEEVTEAADMYAVGVLLYWATVGELPPQPPLRTEETVVSKEERVHYMGTISELLHQRLAVPHTNTCGDAERQKKRSDLVSLLKHLLDVSPSKRYGVDKSRCHAFFRHYGRYSADAEALYRSHTDTESCYPMAMSMVVRSARVEPSTGGRSRRRHSSVTRTAGIDKQVSVTLADIKSDHHHHSGMSLSAATFTRNPLQPLWGTSSASMAASAASLMPALIDGGVSALTSCRPGVPPSTGAWMQQSTRSMSGSAVVVPGRGTALRPRKPTLKY